MFVEHAKDDKGQYLFDSAGKAVRKYHFTEPKLEREFIRRMDQVGMSPEFAFQSMCNCEEQICEAHGIRNDPYPFRKLPPEILGGGMFIHEHKDEAGKWTRDLMFTRLDQVVEAKRRMSEHGMTALQAYYSMCQCADQICPAHGARVTYNAKNLMDNPELRVRVMQLEARRFEWLSTET